MTGDESRYVQIGKHMLAIICLQKNCLRAFSVETDNVALFAKVMRYCSLGIQRFPLKLQRYVLNLSYNQRAYMFVDDETLAELCQDIRSSQ